MSDFGSGADSSVGFCLLSISTVLAFCLENAFKRILGFVDSWKKLLGLLAAIDLLILWTWAAFSPQNLLPPLQAPFLPANASHEILFSAVSPPQKHANCSGRLHDRAAGAGL